RVAMHEIRDLVAAVRVETDVHRVRVAEQVVQVTEDFLIGAREENAEHVRFAVAELVQLETRVAALVADEAIDLAVGVAGDILQRAAARWLLIEPMNRHDRKELIDGPTVGQRLKEREVAEVPVDERRVEVDDDVLELVAILLDEAREQLHRREIDLLGDRALAQ